MLDVNPWPGANEITLGCLAVSRSFREFGPAKVAELIDGTATIEWFDSIANPVAKSEDVPIADLTVWRPPQETRIWFRKDVWRVGRVVDSEFDRFCVRPPGIAADEWIGQEEMYVRWDLPLDDPVPVMQALGMESPYHFSARRRFVAAMLQQHAACRGMRAVPSAAIKIVDHQVDAVSRVMVDPVQRYLLADEVGLGKTIETGLLIRQRLLSNPDAVIRVVAPRQIRHQWTGELIDKFFTDDFILATCDVVASDSSEAWEFDPQMPLDLLVIDEAHHVAAWESAVPKTRRHYERAANAAHHATSLLLLSATPVAHHERTFLAMLHLLDPENYRLNDLTTFRRRVEDRHELSRAMVLFRAGQQLRRMRRNADRLRMLLAGDELALGMLDAVVNSDDDEPQEIVDRKVYALRSAITERHRIYHRMVRHRRDDATDFQVRGRCLAERLSTTGEVVHLLDDWWQRWMNALVEDGTISVARPGHGLLQILLDRAFAFPGMLAAVAAARAGLRGASAELTGPEGDELGSLPVGRAESEVLDSARNLPVEKAEQSAVEAVAERAFAYPRRTKVVVFATYTKTAKMLADALTSRMADGQVSRHLWGMSDEDWRSEIRRFREDNSCNILACDSSAEEGLNLQFADVVLHAELPLSPNRLEQRIGRLDRFSNRAAPIQNVVLSLHTSDSAATGWLDCLESGFRVFERSIATYQFVVDRIMPDILTHLLAADTDRLAELTSTLGDQLETERQELAEQDQLDSISAVDVRDSIAGSVRDLDEEWEEFERAVDGLVWRDKGNLRFFRRPYYRDEQLCTFWSGDELRDRPPLVAADDVTRYFLGATSERDRELPGSFNRATALAHPPSRVWRAGDRFLDALLRYARDRDDRGRTWALWRHAADLGPDFFTAALRFDFVIEPAIRAGTDDATRAFALRATEVLPAWFEVAWISRDLEELQDPELIARLKGGFSRPFGDRRLGRDNWQSVRKALAGTDWEPWCRAAADLAAARVRGRESVTRLTAHACRKAELICQSRLGALRGRTELIKDVDGEIAWEERCLSEVPAAIADPHLVLDSVGLVILAGTPLSGSDR